MGYWVNTTYIRHDDVDEVAAALTAACAAEGMQRVPSPPARERRRLEPMQYQGALSNDLWGAAIFPGAPSWTVIQTAPLELLAERAPGAPRMRLVDLCRRLSASAFQLNVYDGTAAVLAEVSSDGDLLLSGYGAATDSFEWHGEPLDEAFIEAQFRLHAHPGRELAGMGAEEKARAIARHFGGRNAAFCDNRVSVDTLISHKPFDAPGGLAVYFRWPGASRERSDA
ncbi:MAG TPA: hypothetical protein VF216_02105 [Mizugakiibacter sp.]